MKKIRKISALVVLGLLVLGLLIIQPIPAQMEITIKDLGDLGGTGKNVGLDINDAGEAVGMVGNPPSGEPQIKTFVAFIWKPESERMTELGDLGGVRSVAQGINDLGEVVGDSRTSSGENHAFLWTQQDKMTDLGTLGGTGSRASDINALGHVVGDSKDGSGQSHAFLWRAEDGTMTDLGTLGGTTSYAYDINELGMVVGTSATSGGVNHAFLLVPEDTDEDGEPDLWYRDDDTDGINDLMMDINDPGSTTSHAFGVNDLGDVVGSHYGSDGVQHGFFWTEDGGMIDIGKGRANAVNNLRQVVGRTFDAPTEERAFIWTDDGGMTELGMLNDGEKSHAFGINNLGQIVGASHVALGGPWTPVIWEITEPPEKTNERINSAQQRIQQMRDAGKIGRGHARALIQKLETVKNQISESTESGATLEASSLELDEKNRKGAIKILNAFKNQVNAFVNAGILTPEDGELLINDANLIISGLGG